MALRVSSGTIWTRPPCALICDTCLPNSITRVFVFGSFNSSLFITQWLVSPDNNLEIAVTSESLLFVRALYPQLPLNKSIIFSLSTVFATGDFKAAVTTETRSSELVHGGTTYLIHEGLSAMGSFLKQPVPGATQNHNHALGHFPVVAFSTWPKVLVCLVGLKMLCS